MQVTAKELKELLDETYLVYNGQKVKSIKDFTIVDKSLCTCVSMIYTNGMLKVAQEVITLNTKELPVVEKLAEYIDLVFKLMTEYTQSMENYDTWTSLQKIYSYNTALTRFFKKIEKSAVLDFNKHPDIKNRYDNYTVKMSIGKLSITVYNFSLSNL